MLHWKYSNCCIFAKSIYKKLNLSFLHAERKVKTMFKKNMKGAVFALIVAATLTGTAAPVFAADPTSFK